ncbi:MAG: hypothetical protein ABIK28_10535, partial [Planctomycetota bacterium]
MKDVLNYLNTLGSIWFVLFWVILVSPSWAAQNLQEATVPPGTVEIIPEVLDFGRIFDGDSPVKTVTLKNRGETPLTLHRIGTTCGCAIPRIVFPGGKEVVIGEDTFSKDLGVLEPGQEARIDVNFTTWGYKGVLSKRLDIQTSALDSPRRQITVLAEIIDSVKVEPKELDLGEVVRGQLRAGCVTMHSVGIGDFNIIDIKNLPPYLSFKTHRLSTGPDAAFSIEVQTREDPPLGEWSFILQVAVENPYIQVARFPLKVHVVPKVNFRLHNKLLSHEVDFGVFNYKIGKRLTVDIVNLAPQIPYIPEDVSIEGSPYISYHLETIKQGERYRLDIEIQANTPPASFVRACLVIQSNHPDLLRREVNVIGWSSQGG